MDKYKDLEELCDAIELDVMTIRNSITQMESNVHNLE